MIKVN